MANPNLEFQGQERFAAPPARVFALLTDLNALAGQIPDATATDVVDQHTLRATVRPGFAFLRGTLKLVITIDDVVDQRSALMRIDAQGIGQAMQIESRFQIEPDAEGTRLDWEGRVVQLKGLVATVSSALVRGAAEQVIRSAWSGLHEQLDR